MKNKNKLVPIYELRGLKLIGWKDISHALCYLFSKRGRIKNGTLIAINAEKILKLERNNKIKSLIEKAKFRYADGVSIIRSLRKKYPHACISRITGIDLWEALMKRAGSNNIPVFLVGGKPDVLSRTRKKLLTQWKVNIVGIQNGYFKKEEENALFIRIRNSRAKIITVAMGSPKQEILMQSCYLIYPNALYIGVGGTYDVFSGNLKRAPKFLQKFGLEWLYRLLLQPSRIARQLRLLRYLFWHYSGKF